METDKITKLRNILGSGRLINNGTQIVFRCPFCSHHKPKLSIHLELEHYHCWVCDAKGRSVSSLMRKMGQPITVINFFRKNTHNVLLHSNNKFPSDKDKELITLPIEYKPLYIKSNTPDYKHALRYLRQRGLTAGDILKYQIGYCETGPYNGMVILPSYDANFNLNFFTGRSYYPAATRKHKNPKIDKNIIGFEMFVNWQLPIVLVEGAFDAISIKRNAIPLFGKKILPKLKERIILNKVKELYVCLDNDARKDAIQVAQYFSNHGIQVRFVNLTAGDPNELGFTKIQSILENTMPLEFSDMIKLKLLL